jgi:GT2 family glycosyltransferase
MVRLAIPRCDELADLIRQLVMNRTTFGVVITSHNRCDNLRSTCEQLRKLSPAPDEIIICLDGCTDGSRKMLVREFPEFQMIENFTLQGSIPSRDRAFRLVKSDFIVTLDDDSYPTDPAFIEKVRGVVTRHPEAGAITFPELRNDGYAEGPAFRPQSPGQYVRGFPNCAGIMLRALYGREAEYPVFFFHAYAEPDYCLQLYAAGYAVWFEPSLTIRHHFTPKQRDMLRRHHLGARNDLWSTMIRCPFPYLVAVAPMRILRHFIFALIKDWRWWVQEPKWWWNAFKGIPMCLRHRKPICARTYFGWLSLAQNPASSIEELETRLGRRFNAATHFADVQST